MPHTSEFTEALHQWLTARYPQLWSMEQSKALVSDLRRHSEGEILAACVRHRADTTPERHGSDTPIGHWPPGAADIERQITAMRYEQRQAAQQQEAEKRRAEDRANYDAYQRPDIKAQVVRSAQVRAKLQAELDLDYALGCDTTLLLRTIDQLAAYETGLPADAAERCVEVARSLFLDQRNAALAECRAYRQRELLNGTGASSGGYQWAHDAPAKKEAA